LLSAATRSGVTRGARPSSAVLGPPPGLTGEAGLPRRRPPPTSLDRGSADLPHGSGSPSPPRFLVSSRPSRNSLMSETVSSEVRAPPPSDSRQECASPSARAPEAARLCSRRRRRMPRASPTFATGPGPDAPGVRDRRAGVCPVWRPPTADRHPARSRGHPDDSHARRPLPPGAEPRPRPTRVRRRRILIGSARGRRGRRRAGAARWHSC
jgi:hypothetical protein